MEGKQIIEFLIYIGMHFSLEDMNMQMEDAIPCNRIPDIQNESLKVAWAFNLTEH